MILVAFVTMTNITIAHDFAFSFFEPLLYDAFQVALLLAYYSLVYIEYCFMLTLHVHICLFLAACHAFIVASS